MRDTMDNQLDSGGVGCIDVYNFSSTEIHVWRMRVAVFWSIILQVFLLFVFILFINVDLFHPLTWLRNCFHMFLLVDVWLKLLWLVIIIYIQGQVCKKDYVTGPIYYSTRFQKIKQVFSVRNLLLFVLYVVIGGTIFWIYSSVSWEAYQSLTKQCKTIASSGISEICFVESKLFIFLGGLWLGVYYFANDYMFGSRNLSFPLIQQCKSHRVKVTLKENVKQAVKDSVLPASTFLILYYFYGGFIRNKFTELMSARLESEPIDSFQGLMNIQLIFILWLFSSIFMVALKMMEFLFNIYLTQHFVFAIEPTMTPQGKEMSLIDSLKKSDVPILHHLGYLDLFTLSAKCRQRRKGIFTLSHPGGHPHSWNGIFRECTNLIKTFTNDLNEALQQSVHTEKEVKPQPEITSFHFHSHNMRKLTTPLNKDVRKIRRNEYQSWVEVAFNNILNWLLFKFNQIYKKPFVAYFFAESTDSRINYLVCQCQPVIWAVQSLAFLTAASLSEDRYGIVQMDLPHVIVTIVNLKQVLDKLFKQNLIVKRSFANDPLDVQMKYLLRTSVKRSLYKIAVSFGPYIKELSLPVDIELQMNNFITFKEVL